MSIQTGFLVLLLASTLPSFVARDDAGNVVGDNTAEGDIRWKLQVTGNDARNGACLRRTASCPTKNGPDFDIGASAIFAESPTGKELLPIGQKSGLVSVLVQGTGHEKSQHTFPPGRDTTLFLSGIERH